MMEYDQCTNYRTTEVVTSQQASLLERFMMMVWINFSLIKQAERISKSLLIGTGWLLRFEHDLFQSFVKHARVCRLCNRTIGGTFYLEGRHITVVM